MSDILWVIVSGLVIGWLTSKTKKEEKAYRKKEVQDIVHKYKIIAEIIGSSFVIIWILLITLAYHQSMRSSTIAIFLSSLYTLMLMLCTSIFVTLLCKINNHWKPDEIYLAMAVCGNMSLKRMKQMQFFLLSISGTGLIYSIIRILMLNE